MLGARLIGIYTENASFDAAQKIGRQLPPSGRIDWTSVAKDALLCASAGGHGDAPTH